MGDAQFNVEFEDSETLNVELGETTRVSEKDFNKLDNRPKYAGVEMTGDTNIPAVPSSVSQLTNDVNYQTGTQVENSISTAVNAEAEARETADTRIENAVSGLTDALTAETTARMQADTSLGNRITNIEEKIPNQASSVNQLADKNFVNSSIATNTANYISDNGQPFNSLADLEAYSGPLTNNDYAFVVGADSTGNTTYTRYKYIASTESWAEEYVLNNSSFTAVQWEAINSGITSGNVEKIAGLANIKSIGDNLHLGSNGKLNATDTKYAAGNGLNLDGTEFSIDTDVVQKKLAAGDGIIIDDNTISANIEPADFFTAGETVSGEGVNVTLNNTMAVPLASVQLKGDTFQQTYSGKNLFLCPTLDDDPGITRTRLSDNAFKVETNSSYANQYTNITIGNLSPNTAYIFSAARTIDGAATNAGAVRTRIDGAYGRFQSGDIIFTTGESGNVSLLFYNYSSNTAGTNMQNTVTWSNIQIEEGSTATSFEPFVGGIPSPNPDYPQEVQTVTGGQVVVAYQKNMINAKDPSRRFYGYFEDTGSSVMAQDNRMNNIVFWAPCKPNTAYSVRLPASPTNSPFGNAKKVGFFEKQPDIGVEVIKASPNLQSTGSIYENFVSPENGHYIAVRIQASSVGLYIDLIAEALQVEEGTTCTAFDGGHNGFYEINLGKNLFDKNTAPIKAGYFSSAGAIKNSGSIDDLTSLLDRFTYIPCKPNTTYTITKPNQDTASLNRFRIGTANDILSEGDTLDGFINLGDGSLVTSRAIRTGENARYLYFYFGKATTATDPGGEIQDLLDGIQIEEGPSSTPYSPYFTPIELCKIGDYQDYIYKSGDDWYVHTETGKQIVDTATILLRDDYTNIEYGVVPKPTDYGGYGKFGSSYPVVSTHGILRANLSNWNSAAGAGNLYSGAQMTNFWFGFAKGTGLDTIRTKLANCINYYALATATDTQITEQTLIDQLEALKNTLAYDGQTNFTVTAEDLAGILNVTACRKSLAGMIKLLGQ